MSDSSDSRKDQTVISMIVFNSNVDKKKKATKKGERRKNLPQATKTPMRRIAQRGKGAVL